MAGRERWKADTAGRAEKPEQQQRNIEIHIHRETESAKPRTEAAITAGKHAGSSGGSPRIRRTPTQPGIGSPSPDTISPGTPPNSGTETVTLLPPQRPLYLMCVGSLTHTLAQEAPVAGWKPIFKEELDGDKTPSDAAVCPHTYTAGDNG